MDGGIFVWVMVGIFAVLVLFIILLGLFYPGSGAEQLGWRPTRSAELEAENEVDDLEQMLEATNRRRRARGAPELTEDAMVERVREDNALRDRLRDSHLLDAELRQVLHARNERRRAKGLPEMTLDELRASLDVPRPGRG